MNRWSRQIRRRTLPGLSGEGWQFPSYTPRPKSVFHIFSVQSWISLVIVMLTPNGHGASGCAQRLDYNEG